MLSVLLLLLKPAHYSVICTEIVTVGCRPLLFPLSRGWNRGHFGLGFFLPLIAAVLSLEVG